jgi:hypothetical protein
MKERLRSLLRGVPPGPGARNRVREALQASILLALQRCGAMIPLAFHGGTALRFLFSIPRYSEDLDFALERPGDGYDLSAYLEAAQRDLRREGYTPEIAKLQTTRAVQSGFVGFPGLLHEFGLSGQRDEALRIKIEVDTNPPPGAGLQTSIVRRHELLRLQHHDRASLLAGKLHAVLQRPYPKGRDFFDLVWYLADPDWPAPNLVMLNAALAQSGWKGRALTERTWPKAVRARIADLPWPRLLADARPLLEPPADESFLTEETLVGLLERRLARRSI